MTFNALQCLTEAGVDEQVAADWLQLRKAHKAPPTATAIKLIQKQAELAGMSLEDALMTSIEHSWRGFKAEWVASNHANTVARQVRSGATVVSAASPIWFMSSEGIERKAKELSVAQCVGEPFYMFRERVYAAAGVTPEMVRKARIDAGERV